MYMESYGSRLTGACYGGGLGSGGRGAYCGGGEYGVAKAWGPCCGRISDIS